MKTNGKNTYLKLNEEGSKAIDDNRSYLQKNITSCFRRHTEIITSIMNSFYDWVHCDSPIRQDYGSAFELTQRVDRFVYNDILLGVIVESMNAICNKYDGYSEYDRDEFQIFVRNRIMKDKEIICDKFDYIIEDSPMSRSVNTRTGKYIILCLSQSCTDLEDLIVRELKHLLLDILSNTDLDCLNIVQDRGYDVTQIDTDFGKWSTFGGRPVK